MVVSKLTPWDTVQRVLKGNLRTKIIAWSFVPTVIILVTVALVTFTAYQRVTEELVIQRDREVTRLAASQLGTRLTEYAALLTSVARTSDVYGGEPATQRDALHAVSLRLAVFGAGVVMLDSRGTVVAAEPPRSDALGQDWSTHSCYHSVVRARITNDDSPVISDIVSSGLDGAEVVCEAVPITGEHDEFLGVLLGMFPVAPEAVSAIYGDIVKLRLGQGGEHYVVDGAGRIIYHSDTGRIGADLSGDPIVERMQLTAVDAIRTRDRADRDIVASFASVPGTSWGLVIEESWASLTSSSRGFQQFLVLLLVMGVVVPILVVFVASGQITKPVGRLIDAAREVAKGNLSQTITVRTGDEIEELARQFNLMSKQLQASYANLEQRVADRTRDLAALNAVAATVSQSLELDEILNHAIDKALEVIDVEAGGIYLLDDRNQLLNVAAQRGFSPEFVAQIDRLKVGEGFSGRVAQEARPLVVRNIPGDPRLTRMIVREEGLHSLAVVPLSAKGVVLGTLFVATHGRREFSDQDVQLLSSVGHQIGVAVENARFFRAEQRRAEQFRVISEVGRQITSILDIDEVLVQITRGVKETFDYYAVGVGLVEGDEVVFRAGSGAFWDDPEIYQSLRLKVGEEGFTGWVAATGEPLLIPDVSQDPRYYHVPQAHETRSELLAPLKIKGQVIGVLGVQSNRLNAFDRSDLVVLQALANQAAVAIENARFIEAEQRRAEQLRVINQVGRRIALIFDVDEVLVQVVRTIQEAFGYDHVGIALVEGDYAEYKHGAGRLWDSSDFEFRPRRLRVGDEGITGWVAGSGEPLLVPDVRREPRYIEMQDSGTCSELAVPIKLKETVIGVLDIQSVRHDAFDDSDLMLLQALANQAATAIENARLHEQAQQLAVMEERNRLARELHDAVTQTLFSASLIAEALPAIWRSDQGEGEQLLGELRQLNRGALAEMRTLLLELRPAALIEASMPELLRQLAEAVTGRSGVPVEVSIVGTCAMPPDVHVALYRVAQETLNNVVKHAAADRVTITLGCEPSSPGRTGAPCTRVVLSMRDDGRGFDPAAVPPHRLGLSIMRERAEAVGAELQIESGLGEGTLVRFTWKRPSPS
jgi:nitrate/nitrite-specific signal transduction histidine kinase